jgi:hypothetical protein
MDPLLALQITVMTLTDSVKTAAATRLAQLREQDRQAGLSTLEITILALGLFLIAGIAVLVLTKAVQGRLDRIK